MISNVVKNSWNWNLANFRDLVLILPEAATGSVLLKNGVLLKMLQYTQGNAFARVSFYAATLLKKRLWHRDFRVNFCKMFKNTFFAEHLWMTACILQQQIALYFAIKYSWQISSREKLLFGKKKSSIYFEDFTDLDIFLQRYFPLFSLTQSACCTLSRQPFPWIGD